MTREYETLFAENFSFWEHLTEDQKELLQLFDALPESEQKALLSEMRARVENFNKLFEELLKARKRSANK